MKLHIRHETRYRYRQPVEILPQRLLMTPRSGHELTLLQSSLRCTPNAALAWSQDVFGNMIATASFRSPTDELVILGSVAYRVRDEEGTQSSDETLALASGSCRDVAALFIEAARHLGFGARAVSGYLYDPDVIAADGGSTHAWAEIFLPGAGWVAFDPTHRRMGSAQLVAVAVGRSNRQIMPVTGGYVDRPDDAVAMSVSVVVRAV